jgi:hypothetical protein
LWVTLAVGGPSGSEHAEFLLFVITNKPVRPSSITPLSPGMLTEICDVRQSGTPPGPLGADPVLRFEEPIVKA